MPRMSSRIALVLILMLIALEALLHLFPLPDPYALRRSSETRRVHRFLPGWNVYAGWFGDTPPFSKTFITGPLSGVSTTQVEFSVNRFGFPYAEGQIARKSDQEVRIGVIGGSTVECAALEQGKRWPQVLERLLSQAFPGRSVTVLNLGVSGQDTRTHLATVAQHAVKLDLNYLVFMLGANDLFRAGLTSDPLERDDAFLSQECRCVKSFLLRFQLVRRLHVVYRRWTGTEYYLSTEGTDQPYFAAGAREKMSLPVLPTARKNISRQALQDYEMNIVSLAALAVGHDITPIFTTQPMLWKPVMTASEEAVDWLGGTVMRDGSRYRFPASEKARALEALNQHLLKTCSKRHLKCIDLEKRIPRSLQFFYDPVHLNEAGAEGVARHVAEFLVSDRMRLAALAQ